jgi:hypothetical protein
MVKETPHSHLQRVKAEGAGVPTEALSRVDQRAGAPIIRELVDAIQIVR